MSRQLIARSPDLLRLENEGYRLTIRGGFLLIDGVPFVDSTRSVGRGTLISRLELSGDRTNKPADHVTYWTGAHPCHSTGDKITAFENPSPPQDFGDGVRADFTFSAKADYRDYHHKMTTYIGRISGEAQKIDPSANAKTFEPIPEPDAAGVFNYVDTASSRAGIGVLNTKIAGQRIGVVGLGGTGSYVLDLIAKTGVSEIHLFDGDVFSQHNAFRAPGAASLAQLEARLSKVDYFASIYSNMHRGIVAHPIYVAEQTIALLRDLDFVFLCIDRGEIKRSIVESLCTAGKPFIDAGMGVIFDEGQLSGIVRVTLSAAHNRPRAAPYISYAENDAAQDYSTNVQIAELNALNASLAVIRWKKHFGIYRDSRDPFYSGFGIASGEVVNETAL